MSFQTGRNFDDVHRHLFGGGRHTGGHRKGRLASPRLTSPIVEIKSPGLSNYEALPWIKHAERSPLTQSTATQQAHTSPSNSVISNADRSPLSHRPDQPNAAARWSAHATPPSMARSAEFTPDPEESDACVWSPGSKTGMQGSDLLDAKRTHQASAHPNQLPVWSDHLPSDSQSLNPILTPQTPNSPTSETDTEGDAATPTSLSAAIVYEAAKAASAISPQHSGVDRKEELRARLQAKDEALRVMQQEVAFLNEQEALVSPQAAVLSVLDQVQVLSEEVRKLSDEVYSSPNRQTGPSLAPEHMTKCMQQNEELRYELQEANLAREKAEQAAKIAEAKAEAYHKEITTMKVLLDAMSAC